MRNVGAMIVVGFVLAVGLTAFLLWGPLGEKPGMRDVQELSQPPPDALLPPTTQRGSARAAGESSGSGTDTAATTLGAGSEQFGEQAGAAKPARHFPTAAEIAIGMQRSQLEATFGKPSMRTTAVDEGRLLETLVYLQTEPNIATFVLLRNGKVVSANTTIY